MTPTVVYRLNQPSEIDQVAIEYVHKGSYTITLRSAGGLVYSTYISIRRCPFTNKVIIGGVYAHEKHKDIMIKVGTWYAEEFLPKSIQRDEESQMIK
jgi:hypothetical protein